MNRTPDSPFRPPSDSWLTALDHSLQACVGTPANSAHDKAEIRLLDANPSGNRIEVELRFRKGGTYCCCCPGCHLPTYERSWWQKFRAHQQEVSDRDPPPMVMTIIGVVEEGAQDGGFYAKTQRSYTDRTKESKAR